VPGILTFMHVDQPRYAINCGSIQTMSSYAQRYFSLSTAPVFPVISLHPQRHQVNPYLSLKDYLSR
jgi:hypothetical protein